MLPRIRTLNLLLACNLIACTTPSPLPATSPPPPPSLERICNGEEFYFKVKWGPLGTAGGVHVSAQADAQSATPQTRIKIVTASRGLVRTLYAFDGTAESLIDPHDGRLLMATATTRSRTKRTSMNILFDYAANEANYTDNLRPERNTHIPLPDDSQPMEFITALIQARAWNPHPGDTRTIHVIFDNRIYPLTLHALGYEKIPTATSRAQKALLVLPQMDTNPQGIFKKGGKIRVWLACDEQRLPVRFEVKLPIGTAIGLLTRYRSPNSTLATNTQLEAKIDDKDLPD
ncbi:DUF3108 domain-containing protein [Opitutaceae bacterium TAV4]|nr:DUF3108 domain-containing protein [Opitutaceae bacterium TAV4]RRJ98727.1 DUF3108 domain-containing protein [Opitutaceae bacterium TAV3]